MAARGGPFRVTGGTLRGRRFGRRPPPGTRPTAERVREALGSALQARGWVEEAVVLELFAGTGALSFECLSRGARRAVLIERNGRLLRQVRDDAEALGLADRVGLVPLSLPASPERLRERLGPLLPEPATLLLADPPYDRADLLGETLRGLLAAGLLAPGAALALEHRSGTPPAELPPLAARRELVHGDTALLLGRLETT